MSRRVRAWLAQPGLHFVLIGLALFAIARARRPAPTVAPPTGRVAQLRADFIRQTGVPPRPAEEALLAAQALDEELLYREALARGLGAGPAIRFRLAEKVRFFDENDRRDQDTLYREALALGLDQEDAFVRRSLVERMRLIAQREIPDGPVNDATLQAYFERHADHYRQPLRVRITQVFLSRDQHGDGRGRDLEQAAASVLAALRSPTPPALGTLGDPFPIGPTGNLMTQRDLEKLFGPEFARRVMDLTPGLWSGPLPSAYGLHVVRVEAREPGRLPSLAAVRNQVERAYRLEQGELAYAAFLRRLRTKYGVEIAQGHSVSRPEAAPVPGTVDFLGNRIAAGAQLGRRGMNSPAESLKSPLKGTPTPVFAVGFSRLRSTEPGNSFPGDRRGTLATSLSRVPSAGGAG